MYVDRRIEELARAQHGAFSRSQARQAGLSETMIDERVRHGRWVKLTAGVYAHPASPPTWERQLQAALLSRPGSVAAGHSAAHLHRFTGFNPGRPTIMSPPQGNGRLAIGTVLRVSDFDEVVVGLVDGFPVTSVAETLWTLCRFRRRNEIRDLIGQEISMGHTTTAALETVLARVQGTRQKGLPIFRDIISELSPSDEATASNLLEAVLYRLLGSPGIPPVKRQHPFALSAPSRVDAYIESWGLVVEADGRNWHTRQADFQRDRIRDNELAAMGIQVIRFTYADLTQRFDQCLTTLLAAGRHRRAMTGR